MSINFNSILVTGATGFLGQSLIRELIRFPGIKIYGLCRHAPLEVLPGVIYIESSDISEFSIKLMSLSLIDVIIHTAALTHSSIINSSKCFAEYRRINVKGTMDLAEAGLKVGIRNFIFISSVKVNGNISKQNCQFNIDDIPNPVDAYGVSKYEAEQALLKLSESTGLRLIIIRPPLIYGKGVKANYRALELLIKMGVPLPLSGFSSNKRSYVSVDNICNFIVKCLQSFPIKKEIFFVSDGRDLSTVELIKHIALINKKHIKIFYFPPILLKYFFIIICKSSIYEKLSESLTVNIDKNYNLLGWKPNNMI